ncbi:hypothetical protein EOD41_00305 [Mucilaginibacter limnophilus]|uniref:AraC family transcriptional regulator n=1 Tax=Mucilaginibacter limnophilus TaxID=1932778 RepID=A0A3S2UQY2_9SPHI|nr:hypothetical protein [Mucilaginibacter limnophilus]RVU02417.1 hypothetical protein EOD41_00305 [Mucilaginibacter limnophilus]
METKQFEFKEDIQTVCVEADFPNGIKDAYYTLEERAGRIKKRHVYGVSEMINGKLRYKACAEALEPGEAQKLGLKEYLIPKGSYMYTVFQWQGNEHQIGNIFAELLQQPGVKSGSIGIEFYQEKMEDVWLMVQLA